MRHLSTALLAALALATSLSVSADDWRWQVESDDDSNRVGIRPRAEGFATLEAALSSLGEDQVVVSVGLEPMARPVWEQVQKEIFDYLEDHYPEELKAASSSSGNLHNPKLGPVMSGYRDAVRSTSYVAELAEILAKHGYRIADVGFEKFSMNTRQDPPTFSAITWLQVDKVEPPASGADEP